MSFNTWNINAVRETTFHDADYGWMRMRSNGMLTGVENNYGDDHNPAHVKGSMLTSAQEDDSWFSKIGKVFQESKYDPSGADVNLYRTTSNTDGTALVESIGNTSIEIKMRSFAAHAQRYKKSFEDNTVARPSSFMKDMETIVTQNDPTIKQALHDLAADVHVMMNILGKEAMSGVESKNANVTSNSLIKQD